MEAVGEQAEKARGSEIWLALGAGTALLWASLANYLVHNDFPLLRPESLALFAALFAVSALMAAFYVPQRRWGRSLLEGLLVVLFIDLNSTEMLFALIAGVAVGLLTWWFDRSLLKPMALIGAVILVTTILGVGGSRAWLYERSSAAPQPARPAGGSGQPAILHLILDEHGGIAGMRGEGAEQLQNELRQFYLDRGFAVYDRAYSEHMHTINALPHVVNYGQGLAARASKNGVRIGPSKHLQRLHQLGYRLTVLQSDFAEFCEGNPVAECLTYNSGSPRPILGTPLSFGERTGLIAVKFLALSRAAIEANERSNQLLKRLSRFGVPAPSFEIYNYARSSTVGALAATDFLIDRVRSARPGEAFFAHLLLPHYPHVVRSDCSYLPWREWELRRWQTSVEERRRSYAVQVRCTMRKIDELLRSFAASEGGRNGIVIIHGDHGTRIVRMWPVVEYVGKFDADDMVGGHSTLFVVRGPGVEPKSYPEPQSTAPLLRDFVESGFAAAPVPQPSRDTGVILGDAKWHPRQRAPMPAHW